MGYRPVALPLELASYQTGDPDTSLLVKVVAPSVLEGSLMNAGRAQVPDGEGGTREETQDEFQRRCFSYLAPKIREWTLDGEDGTPVPLPRELHPGSDEASRRARVDHLYAQDENIIFDIWREWRMAGMPKKADSAEGKASETQSTNGHDASPEISLAELESQIPM